MINPWDKLKKYWFKQGWDAGVAKAELEANCEINASEYLINKLETELENLKNQVEEYWFVDKNKVFSVTNTGLIKLGDNPMTRQELSVLKADIKTFKQMSFLGVLFETIKQKSIEKSVINSNVNSVKQTNLELLAGKMMLHNLGIMKSIIDLVEKSQ
jgi:hypothetical protein